MPINAWISVKAHGYPMMPERKPAESLGWKDIPLLWCVAPLQNSLRGLWDAHAAKNEHFPMTCFYDCSFVECQGVYKMPLPEPVAYFPSVFQKGHSIRHSVGIQGFGHEGGGQSCQQYIEGTHWWFISRRLACLKREDTKKGPVRKKYPNMNKRSHEVTWNDNIPCCLLGPEGNPAAVHGL